MKKEIKFKAYHKPTKTWYWFDVMHGNKQSMGTGYIPMLPIGTEIKRHLTMGDNRIPIDPAECSRIIPY
jgi:hypothetical protein